MIRLRNLGAAVCVAACVLAAGCGEAPEPQPGVLIEQADEAFARGESSYRASLSDDSIDGARDARATAAEAWSRAADAYRDAFRLLDPTPAFGTQRALVGFRIARALGKAAEVGVAPRVRDFRAQEALLWLAQVERLAPEMRQVWYERAVLHESDVERVRDPMRAHAAYTRYLQMVAEAGPVPGAEAERVAHARARAAALAPAQGDPEPPR